MKVFLKIILPTSTPILATIAIFVGCGAMEFLSGYAYLCHGSEAVFPAVHTLSVYKSGQFPCDYGKKQQRGTNLNMAALATQQTPTSIRMTVSVIVVMPILFIYPMFQRYFVKGIMIGSVKG